MVTLAGSWLPFMPSTTSGGSAPSASVVSTIEEIRYFFKDHLGSVVTVTNGLRRGDGIFLWKDFLSFCKAFKEALNKRPSGRASSRDW
jgi:hypothetical protein